MNLVILQGNVGEDPRIKDFDNGGKVAQFSLATTEKGYKTQDGRDIPDETVWHNIVVKRSGLAGVCQQYVKKGSPLLIRGKISNRQYTDTQGVVRYITEVIVEDLTLLAKREREQAPAPAPEYKQAPGNYQSNGHTQQYQPQYQPPQYNRPVNGPLFNDDGDMPDFMR